MYVYSRASSVKRLSINKTLIEASLFAGPSLSSPTTQLLTAELIWFKIWGIVDTIFLGIFMMTF